MEVDEVYGQGYLLVESSVSQLKNREYLSVQSDHRFEWTSQASVQAEFLQLLV